MNINFTEINNLDNVQPKNKKMTYDDILSSLNLVVSSDGVLQYMNVKSDKMNNLVEDKQAIKKVVTNDKIDPYVKNSFIYNKYFKDYKDELVNEAPRIPLTQEEYKKMVVENLINKIYQKKRISQIKSKKLLFNNNNSTNIPVYANRNNLNRLFKF